MAPPRRALSHHQRNLKRIGMHAVVDARPINVCLHGNACPLLGTVAFWAPWEDALDCKFMFKGLTRQCGVVKGVILQPLPKRHWPGGNFHPVNLRFRMTRSWVDLVEATSKARIGAKCNPRRACTTEKDSCSAHSRPTCFCLSVFVADRVGAAAKLHPPAAVEPAPCQQQQCFWMRLFAMSVCGRSRVPR